MIGYVGWLLVALRYIWVWRFGAPVFDWVVWMLMALTMPFLALFLVSEVSRYVF